MLESFDRCARQFYFQMHEVIVHCDEINFAHSPFSDDVVFFERRKKLFNYICIKNQSILCFFLLLSFVSVVHFFLFINNVFLSLVRCRCLTLHMLNNSIRNDLPQQIFIFGTLFFVRFCHCVNIDCVSVVSSTNREKKIQTTKLIVSFVGFVVVIEYFFIVLVSAKLFDYHQAPTALY